MLGKIIKCSKVTFKKEVQAMAKSGQSLPSTSVQEPQRSMCVQPPILTKSNKEKEKKNHLLRVYHE